MFTFSGSKLADNISNLFTTKKDVQPEQMKRFMYSVLKNAVDQDDVSTARGMSHAITLIMVTIYDFDEVNANPMELNDAHWEIINRKPVKASEIAAYCLTAMKYVEKVIDTDLPTRKEYAMGLVTSIAALAEIMNIELSDERNSNED